VFVEYANPLNNWRRGIKRISTALTIDLTTRDEGAIEDYDLAVFALSLHHLPPALAARVFTGETRAANKLLIIDLHVWRRSLGAMACTLARFTARRTTRHRTSAWAGSWLSALQVCDLLLLATLQRTRSTAHMKPC
jgi:hypothetical protein